MKILALLISIVLLIGAALGFLLYPRDPPAQQRAKTAYQMAKKAILQQYPGARKLSPFKDSPVAIAGDIWTISIVVDGLNDQGGPVRNTFEIQYELEIHDERDVSRDQWIFKRIRKTRSGLSL